MKTIYVIKSEKDNSIYVGGTADVQKILTEHNAGRMKATKKKVPWVLVSYHFFEREQTASDFESYLTTEAGQAFIEEYCAFNPLSELKKILQLLPASCQVYVMGGLALDGHRGSLTRRHDDADLLCWRKDVQTVKRALKKMGYGIRDNYFKDRPKVSYRFETDEEVSALSFNIIDEADHQSFEISLGRHLHQIFPKTFLGPIKTSLEGVVFPAVSLRLLDALNKNASQWFARTKKENPKLYKMLGYKVDNFNHDRKFLDEFAGSK